MIVPPLAVGTCAWTPAFGGLRSRFVLHTVGPAMKEGSSEPTSTERTQLYSCYQVWGRERISAERCGGT